VTEKSEKMLEKNWITAAGWYEKGGIKLTVG